MDNEPVWKSLQLANESLRYADAKATGALAVNGLLLSLVAVRVPSTSDFASHPAKAYLVFAALVCVVLSVLFGILVVLPSRGVRAAGRSLLRADDVAAVYGNRREAYVNEFVGLMGDPSRLTAALATEVWANSVVARRKHRLVFWSIAFLIGGFGFAGAAGLATSMWG